MVAEISRRDGEAVTVSVTVRLDGSMLEAEEAIQEALNEAGMLLEQENLVRFDTDGSPICRAVRLTSRAVAAGLRDSLRAGLGGTSRLPDRPRRENLLSLGKRRPTDP